MDLLVGSDGIARFGDRTCRAALGRSGAGIKSREGDGVSPLGAWPLRRLLWRPDRLERPASMLTMREIRPADGWCDAAGDPAYNLEVALPYPASAEHLWRDDHLYDVIVPLGFNDAPVVDGAGSAIFLHVARPDYGPTEGCVALAIDDLLAYLAVARPDSRVVISR